jgi:formate dehydrogenase beta subunit
LLDGRSLELVIGAGAYIAGEETAMLESMEGRRAMPRLRPPFPAQVGYLGRPTLINNVETLAHLPAILGKGGEWWARLGTREAKGTRLWSVSGAVGKPGCYEAPNGITIRELVEEHAGGFAGEIGSIVPGGAASGILPPDAVDTPLTRDALGELGAGVGSAALQVFPASYSPVRLLAETMRFFAEESCQKCTPCRIGNRALHHLFAELEHGGPAMTREKVDEWLLAMEKTSICGLGQAAPIPVRNALSTWPEHFAALEEAVSAG